MNLYYFFRRRSMQGVVFIAAVFLCLSILIGKTALSKTQAADKNFISGQNLSDIPPGLEKPMDKMPFINVLSEPDTVKVRASGITPTDTIVTHTIKFGQTVNSTTDIDSAYILAILPDLGEMFDKEPYYLWANEEMITPKSVAGYDIISDTNTVRWNRDSSNENMDNIQGNIDSIKWYITGIPAKSSEEITFRLKLDVEKISSLGMSSKDLWITAYLFPLGDTQDRPAIGKKDVRVEFYPKLEVNKIVESDSVYPGETFDITITYRNTVPRPVNDVVIKDSLWVDNFNILNLIDVDNIQYSNPPAETLLVTNPDSKSFPVLEWSIDTISDTLWHNIIMTIPIRPYADFKDLLSGTNYNISDFITIKERNDDGLHGFADSQRPEIILCDLAPTLLLPKIFGNQASPYCSLFVYTEIKNIGFSYVNNTVKVRLLVDGTPVLPEKNITGIGNFDLPHPISWLSDPLEPGEHVLTVSVDDDNRFREVDEDNNKLSTTITVGYENINLDVNRVTWLDQLEIGGLKPTFPSPIFAQIMVTDQNYHYFSGLADNLENINATNWSKVGDPVFGGQTLSETWPFLYEIDEESPVDPEPEVTDYQITRIMPNVEIPISIAIVMDREMPADEFNVMKASLKNFISAKNPEDKIAIVSFPGTVTQLTTNVESLDEVINNLGNEMIITKRDVLQALNSAITMLKKAEVVGRKMILLCTDKSFAIENIIKSDFDEDESLPIFVFAIDLADDPNLTMLADTTGGLFMSESSEHLKKFAGYDLSMFHEMFRNYYIMAYATPDSSENERWRNLGISINYSDSLESAFDVGRYKAPVFGVDLTMNKNIESGYDSLKITEFDTLYYGSIEDTFQFTLEYRNKSTNSAHDVVIWDVLPSKYTNIDVQYIDPEPDSIVGDTLFWHIDELTKGEGGSIRYTLFTDSDSIMYGGVMLMNKAGIYQANTPDDEPDLDNNIDSLRVFIPTEYPMPPKIIPIPPVVNVGDTVKIGIETYAPIYNWRLFAILANGDTISVEFFNRMEGTRPFEPGDQEIIAFLFPASKVTTNDEEKITFILTAYYIDNTVVVVDTFVVVRSELQFFLDQNVFLPGKDDNIGYHFRVPGPMHVKIRVFNIAGEFVKTILDEDFTNAVRYDQTWDALDKNDNGLGSGVYIFILEANGKTIQRKLAVIR